MPIRVNYFDRQFLKVDEFKDEQAYHLGARRRLTSAVLDWGIVHGLEVQAAELGHVTVSAGMAVDSAGRELVLGAGAPVRYDVPDVASGRSVYITIAYAEDPDEASRSDALGAPQQATRMIESGKVTLSVNEPPGDGSVVVLGRYVFEDSPVDPFPGPGPGPIPGPLPGPLPGPIWPPDDLHRSRPRTASVLNDVRRYAGARRLAAGATAAGALGVFGPLTVQQEVKAQQHLTVLGDLAAEGAATVKGTLAAEGPVDAQDTLVVRGALTAKSTLAVSGHASVGCAAVENSEVWNRVLEIQGGGNARITLRSHPDPKLLIDGRIQVHDKGWWGSKPGMIVGTGSSHDLSFGVGRVVKMSLNQNDGVVVSAPFTVKGSNLATFESDVSVKGKLSAAMISSPMWQATQLIDSSDASQKGLPITTKLETKGGMLLVFMNGSGWSNVPYAKIGMELLIGERRCASSLILVNEGMTDRHLAFPGAVQVVPGIRAGTHEVTLRALPSTFTDANDRFNLTVLELPF